MKEKIILKNKKAIQKNVEIDNKKSGINTFLKVLMCILVGAINGLFGGGGGMVCVPMLMCFFLFEEKNAHATTILIILASSIFTLIGYSIKIPNLYANWAMIIAVSIGVFVGGILGAFCLNKIKTNVLQKCFAVVMLGAGIFMILK